MAGVLVGADGNESGLDVDHGRGSWGIWGVQSGAVCGVAGNVELDSAVRDLGCLRVSGLALDGENQKQ